jgi:micrococcal nuclease
MRGPIRRRHIGGGLGLIIALVIAVLNHYPQARTTVINSQPGLYPITHINDGDTIVVDIAGKKETIRFIGVDTPEVKDPRKPVQCFGEAASAHTKEILTGKSVRLVPDPLDSDRDKYGRLLRYVMLPDGTDYNASLIRDGYGFAYVVFPYQRIDDYRKLETEARTANRGLWAGCGIDSSTKIEQTTSK